MGQFRALCVATMLAACSDSYDAVSIGDCTIEVAGHVVGLSSLTTITIDGDDVRLDGLDTGFPERYSQWHRLAPRDKEALIAEFRRCQKSGR